MLRLEFMRSGRLLLAMFPPVRLEQIKRRVFDRGLEG